MTTDPGVLVRVISEAFHGVLSQFIVRDDLSGGCHGDQDVSKATGGCGDDVCYRRDTRSEVGLSHGSAHAPIISGVFSHRWGSSRVKRRTSRAERYRIYSLAGLEINFYSFASMVRGVGVRRSQLEGGKWAINPYGGKIWREMEAADDRVWYEVGNPS